MKENRFKKFAEAEVEEVPEVVEAVEEPKQTPKETTSSLVAKLKSDSSERRKIINSRFNHRKERNYLKSAKS
ncbi:hypothetical protein [Enterococcus faecium]|uniref:hypothetical protein n=1 Tax=Enterococcus faecium TaxID=1352 RepID=UPI001F296369|nr:hypothetical protein [Enterococcus faecium]